MEELIKIDKLPLKSELPSLSGLVKIVKLIKRTKEERRTDMLNGRDGVAALSVHLHA